jgi:hypothetical protein
VKPSEPRVYLCLRNNEYLQSACHAFSTALCWRLGGYHPPLYVLAPTYHYRHLHPYNLFPLLIVSATYTIIPVFSMPYQNLAVTLDRGDALLELSQRIRTLISRSRFGREIVPFGTPLSPLSRVTTQILCNGTKQKSQEASSGPGLAANRHTSLHNNRDGIHSRLGQNTCEAFICSVNVFIGIAYRWILAFQPL